MLIIETLINLFQAFFEEYFLTKCLGKQKQYEEWQIRIGMIFPIFIYLEMQLFVTDFESYAVVFMIIFTSILSYVFCSKDVVLVLVYNVVITVMAMFSSIIGAGIIGALSGLSFLQLTDKDTYMRIAALILIQFIWFFFLMMIIKFQSNRVKEYNKTYAVIALAIPMLSIVICTIILTEINDVSSNAVWNIIVAFGILLLNFIDFVLLDIVNRYYGQVIENQITIHSYEQQKLDVEHIKSENIQLEKNRHEMKKMISYIAEMASENKNDKLLEYLGSVKTSDIVKSDIKAFTDNVVLNYVLNSEAFKCERMGIDYVYLINGSVDGAADIDIHILVENLLDNAVEAIEKSEEKMLRLIITSNEECIEMEIVNSTKGNVLENNPRLLTTKADASHHGFGISNIKEIVDRYNGSIEYSYMKPDALRCQIVLIKQKQGDSR